MPIKLTRPSQPTPPETPLKPPVPARSAAELPAPSPPASQPTAAPVEPSNSLTGGLDQALAIAEVLDFPMHLLPDLPAPWTLTLRSSLRWPDQRRTVVAVLTSDRQVYTEARQSGVCALHKGWVYPLALAAEHDRGTPQTLVEWLDRARTGWDLTPETAIGALPGRFVRRGWPTRRVLHRYDLELVSVS